MPPPLFIIVNHYIPLFCSFDIPKPHCIGINHNSFNYLTSPFLRVRNTKQVDRIISFGESFLHNYIENICVLIKFNVLFNNKHLILIWSKNYFEDIKSRKSSIILMKIRENLLFFKSFSVSITFLASIENHLCYPNKEKTYKLFVYSCNMFPVIDPKFNTI